MRVSKKTPPPSSRRSSRPKPEIVLQIGLLALAFAVGFLIHQQGWHRPLVTAATSFVQRPAFTITTLFHRSDLPTLQIDLRFEDYQRLLDKRAQALQIGANIVSDLDNVPVSIETVDATVTAQMRLRQGPAAPLNDEVWPFEIMVENNAAVLDLQRFTLVPADETVLSTWGYLESLRRAGLPSSRYHLVHLVLNGTAQGLYAMEEQPSAASLAAQGQPVDTVLTFDASGYWEAATRLGTALPGSGFQYAQIATDCLAGEPYTAACRDAARTLQAVQSGEISSADLWDRDQWATFQAISMLWWGRFEQDWRTLQLAYNASTARFQPIATATTWPPITPLPYGFTDDPQLQAATARTLAQFSSPDDLAQLRADLEDDLEALQLDLGAELGYLELPWAALEANQAAMRYLIAPARTLSAVIEADDTALTLRLYNIQPFPVEIVSLDVGENLFLTVDPTWVVESGRALLVDDPDAIILRAAGAAAPQPVRLRIPPEHLPAGHQWVGQPEDGIQIITRLYGFPQQHIAVTARFDDPAFILDTQGREP